MLLPSANFQVKVPILLCGHLRHSNQFGMFLISQLKCIFMFLCHVAGIPQRGTVLCAIAVTLATAWDIRKRWTLFTPDNHFKLTQVVQSLKSKFSLHNFAFMSRFVQMPAWTKHHVHFMYKYCSLVCEVMLSQFFYFFFYLFWTTKKHEAEIMIGPLHTLPRTLFAFLSIAKEPLHKVCQ